MTQPSAFDARGYWEKRLSQDWDLRGVGFRRLGRRYNSWAYRQRGEVFARTVVEELGDLTTAKVLDIGSGTGFYVRAWQGLGVKDITGVDITEAAVGRLRRQFPNVRFIRADISDGLPEVAERSIDAVSAMDVLFHIVDDGRFAQALRSIARLLKPGGVLLFSDMFLHHREIREPHLVYRRLTDIKQMANDAGLTVVHRRPVFITMIQPIDTRSKVLPAAWFCLGGLASLAEPLGAAVGRSLYALDSRWAHRRTESPSLEIMVCRRS